MAPTRSGWLVAAGTCSAVASVAHLGCIVGGASWYRFFGAGEQMARMAERGEAFPTLVTVGIAIVLAGWAGFAFAGAGLIPRPPLLRPALVAITTVYFARAAALPFMLETMPDRGVAFLYWSSAIVLVVGVLHAIGLATRWRALG